MIVAADTTFLSLLWYPDSKPTPNPQTGKPVDHCVQRIEALVDTHSKRGDTVIIPSPCLAELLIAVPDLQKVVNEIVSSAAYEVAPFDARAAIDLAETIRNAAGKKRRVNATRHEIKFDRQIAAIAKANGAEIFYTDDGPQTTFAEDLELSVVHTWNLDLPPKYAQRDFIDEPDS